MAEYEALSDDGSLRCHRCDAVVHQDEASCGNCGEERPSGGWIPDDNKTEILSVASLGARLNTADAGGSDADGSEDDDVMDEPLDPIDEPMELGALEAGDVEDALEAGEDVFPGVEDPMDLFPQDSMELVALEALDDEDDLDHLTDAPEPALRIGLVRALSSAADLPEDDEEETISGVEVGAAAALLDDDEQDVDDDPSGPIAIQIQVGSPPNLEDEADEADEDEESGTPVLSLAANATQQVQNVGAPIADGPLRWQELVAGNVFMGRYRVERPIEDSVRTRRYAAVQEPMVRRVELSLLRADAPGSDDGRRLEESFLEEASELSGLRHPHVARTLDYGQAKDGTCYVISELLYGLTLRDVLQRGPLDPRRAVPVFLQVARGLEALHDGGLVHRIVTPSHVVLETEGIRDKARIHGVALGHGQLPFKQWVDFDNAPFAAPEQLAGEAVTPESDLYSFGAVLYRALYGQNPVSGETVEEIRAAQVQSIVVPPKDDVPERLGSLIQRCLQANPEERFNNMFDVVEELRGISEEIAPYRETAVVAAAAAPAVVPVLPAPEPVQVQQGFTFAHVAMASGLGAGLAFAALGGFWLLVGEDLMKPEVEIRTVEVTKEVPVRVEVPVPVEVPAPPPVVEEAPKPKPKPRTRTRTRTKPKPTPKPTPTPEPETTPTLSKVPEVQPLDLTDPEPSTTPDDPVEPTVAPDPVEEPQPEPTVEEGPASVLSGVWIGKAGGDDLVFELSVAGNGRVTGKARVSQNGVVQSGSVRGQVNDRGNGSWTVELVATIDNQLTTFSGNLSGDSAKGKMYRAGKKQGTWTVKR